MPRQVADELTGHLVGFAEVDDSTELNSLRVVIEQETAHTTGLSGCPSQGHSGSQRAHKQPRTSR